MALPRTVTPLDAYTTLVNDLPQWISDVEALRRHTSTKHAEFVAEYTRLLSNARPRRKKTASVSSLRSGDHDEEANPPNVDTTPLDPTSTPAADLVEISPFEAGNKYLYAQVRRRRKPGSSVRSGASGPQRFRTKQMVVIYYDSHVQEQLEALVRKLGAIRNDLRRAKQTTILNRGLYLPQLRRKYDVNVPSSASFEARPFRTTRSMTQKPPADAPAATLPHYEAHSDATFLAVDRDLETAQNLCETAAHQFLRDGDCKVELEDSLKRLESVLGISKEVKAQLEVEKQEAEANAKERAAARGEDVSTDDGELTGWDIMAHNSKSSSNQVLHGTVEGKIIPTLGENNTSQFTSQPPHQPMMMGLGTAEIEVDDESDMSDIEIDIKQFRMARAAGLRI